MKKVLVLLATHNGWPWLDEQLDSILCQDGVDLSILVGDDCSSDRTVELLRKYHDGGKVNVLEFKQPAGNAGQSFIRLLRTVDIEKFDYVAFSDQDDIWMTDKISRAIVQLQLSGAAGYSAAVTAFWPHGRETVLSQNQRITDLDFVFEGAGQGCTFVFCKDLARRLRSFFAENEDSISRIHYHDWLTYALSRAWRNGWIFDSKPCLRYRQHGGNDTGARGALVGVKKRLFLVRNGWYGEQVREMISAVSLVTHDERVLPEDFLCVWNMPQGFTRRTSLALILLRRGRRRFSDRIVLAASSMLGWL